jgi:hypothetical protein
MSCADPASNDWKKWFAIHFSNGARGNDETMLGVMALGFATRYFRSGANAALHEGSERRGTHGGVTQSKLNTSMFFRTSPCANIF